MRFGSPWVAGGNARAIPRQRSWDPLMNNFSEKSVHSAQSIEEQLYTPARRSAVADINKSNMITNDQNRSKMIKNRSKMTKNDQK